MLKRWISLILVLVMVLGMMPVQAFAGEATCTEITESAQCDVEETAATEPTEVLVEATVEVAADENLAVPEETFSMGTETEVEGMNIESDLFVRDEEYASAGYGDPLTDGLDDSYDYPTIIDNGQTLSGSVSSDSYFVNGILTMDLNDWFRFELPHDANVTIRVSSSRYPAVVLYDSSGYNIGTGTTINKDLSMGSYTVAVNGGQSNGTTYYTISLNYCSHPYASSTSIPATCEEDGYISYTCPSCNRKWTEKIPALGHRCWNWSVQSEPTCAQKGMEVGWCTRCANEVYRDIDMLPHTYGTPVIIVEATCKSKGKTKETCADCGYENVVQTPVLPHEMSNKTLETAPTSEYMGLYRGKCATCSMEMTENIRTLPYGEYTFVIKDGVVAIGENAFYGSMLSEVIIPDSVTKIESGAFEDSYLRRITIPDSVTWIGSSAFEGCESLTEIIIPQSVSYIGGNLFTDCKKLTKIELPKGITSIPNSTFRQCTSLCEIIIPEKVTVIGRGAFKGCESLESIEIPGSVSEIEDSAFFGCKSLTSITIPDNVTTMGEYVFYNCDKLFYVSLPAGIKRIEMAAFSGCKSLTEITLPNNVTAIGINAFTGCENLTSITIPANVTSIAYRAFEKCTNLEKVYFTGDAPKVYPSSDIPFAGIRADAYYPAGNATWTTEAQSLIGGSSYLTWNSCNHSFADATCEKAASCKNCGALSALADHSYTAATCTKAQSCTVCGKLKGVAKGHRFTSYVYNQDATCTQNGTKTAKCDRCNEKETVIALGTALGHTSEVIPKVDATCTKTGLTEGMRCSVCEIIMKEQATIPLLKHKEVADPAVEPTCIQNGLTEGSHCVSCGTVLAAQEVVMAFGHTEITDSAVEPTCTATGLTEGSHCSVCETVLVPQKVIPAKGHTEVIDEAVAPTCTETGLTEGSHCSVCSEVLIAQRVIEAAHIFSDAPDTLCCSVCGYTTSVALNQEYILLSVGQSLDLRTVLNPIEILGDVQWRIEGDRGVVSISEDGVITAEKAGCVYLVAAYGDWAEQRCRIDVSESKYISGVSLSTNKLTAELYSTDYTEFEILLKLPQNYSTTASVTEKIADHGVAIDSAKFTSPDIARVYDLAVKDDRTLVMVPTAEALKRSPELVAGTYKSLVAVTVRGNQTYRTEEVTISVKASRPKLKATVPAFNSFYAGQAQELMITGATVTDVVLDASKAQPDWLTLEGQTLILKENAPAKSASTKVNLLIYTEEWSVPAEVTLNVKNTYKAATLKLSASSVTLNTATRDQASVMLAANPADFDISEPTFRLTDSTGKVDKTGELTVNYENGKITVSTTEKTKGNYKLCVSVGKTKEVALTVKTVSAKPAVTFKVTGNPDISIPNSTAIVTPAFKNYSGSFRLVKMTAQTMKGQTVTEQFTAAQEGNAILVGCESNTLEGTYVLELQMTLADGSRVSNTAKITVKKTALKLKLSASKLVLNKMYDDIGIVTVTSAANGYGLEKPVWQLMDKTGKNPADGKLDIRCADGRLSVAVNESTEYGATYKLLVKAGDGHPAQTLTVTILAYNKSDITSTLKTGGSIDVIRKNGSIVITPSYKNLNTQTVREEKLVFYKTVGKTQVDVSDLFDYTANPDGSFTVAKAENARLDHSGKYTAVLTTLINGKVAAQSKPAALSVKMGSTKLTLTAVNAFLFSQDKHDRAEFVITAADATLNKIAKVEIKDAKYQNILEIIDYGNGEYAIGFKDGKVDSSLIGKTVTVNFDIFVEGNQTAKANTNAKMKLTILK